MKSLIPAIAAVTFLGLAGPAMAASPICLMSRQIESTAPRDNGKALMFRMKDGSVWRNDLRGQCPDLNFNGFAWTTNNPGAAVCENEQTLRVFRSGEICRLGNFTRIEPRRRG